MNTSLDHLPADKREILARAVATIRAEVPEAGMIILYGSHARGDWTHNPQTGYRSDFDPRATRSHERPASPRHRRAKF